jgi:DNA modification methylase
VTSPPYWGLRDYGCAGQIGREATPQAFVETMVEVFRGVRRVLRDDGTLWLNLGDTYAGGGNGGGGSFAIDGTRLTRLTGVDKDVAGRKGNRGITAGLKPKDLVGIPWRVALALQADGWYLRSDIIWHKPNPMPESVGDRPTKAHEYIFLLSKSLKYHYDAEAIREPVSGTAAPRMSKTALAEIRKNRAAGLCATDSNPNGHGINPKSRVEQYQVAATSSFKRACALPMETRNKRDVWTVGSEAYSEAHFATFPPDLIKPCILAGCPAGHTVLDPFGGSGTTGQVALELGRKAVLIELNSDYLPMMERRTNVTPGLKI